MNTYVVVMRWKLGKVKRKKKLKRLLEKGTKEPLDEGEGRE